MLIRSPTPSPLLVKQAQFLQLFFMAQVLQPSHYPSGSCFLDSNLHKIPAFQNILDALETCSKNVNYTLKQCMSVSIFYSLLYFFDSVISEVSPFGMFLSILSHRRCVISNKRNTSNIARVIDVELNGH